MVSVVLIAAVLVCRDRVSREDADQGGV